MSSPFEGAPEYSYDSPNVIKDFPDPSGTPKFCPSLESDRSVDVPDVGRRTKNREGRGLRGLNPSTHKGGRIQVRGRCRVRVPLTMGNWCEVPDHHTCDRHRGGSPLLRTRPGLNRVPTL